MREKFIERKIILANAMTQETAIQVIKHAPIDPIKSLEVIVREQVKARKPDQNSLMWAGPLKDIAKQAWVNGRRYSAEVWHEHFKQSYLPEIFIDLEGLVKSPEVYRKWDFTPNGERVLIGSTTDLTVKGFALYLEQIYAEGAGMGVLFSVDMRKAAR